MNEQQTYNQIIAKCWTDESFKQSLIDDPKTVLAEFGVKIDDSVKLRVLEDSDDEKILVIPAKPSDADIGEILEGRKAACGLSGCHDGSA